MFALATFLLRGLSGSSLFLLNKRGDCRKLQRYEHLTRLVSFWPADNVCMTRRWFGWQNIQAVHPNYSCCNIAASVEGSSSLIGDFIPNHPDLRRAKSIDAEDQNFTLMRHECFHFDALPREVPLGKNEPRKVLF
jgi:hypothetical protein